MSWSRLDDTLYDNEKALSFTDREFRLWISSISYASRRGTDGYLSPIAVSTLLRLLGYKPSVANGLVAKGGWESSGDGYVIHDFLEYNPAAADRKHISEARAAAGRLGGRRSGEARRRPDREATAETTGHANEEARAESYAEANASSQREANANNVPTRTRPDPTHADVTEPATKTEETNETSGSAPPLAAVASRSERPRPPKPDYTPEFDAFWAEWPRKEDKKAAFAAYVRRRQRDRRDAEPMQRAARHVAEYVRVVKPELDKIPHPSTFLNRHRDEEWQDGPPEAHRQAMERARRRNGRITPYDLQDRKWQSHRPETIDAPSADEIAAQRAAAATGPAPYVAHGQPA